MNDILYKSCPDCSYDILDDEGNIMSHYCLNDNWVD